MNIWIRRIIGAIFIGGGAYGQLGVLQLVLSGQLNYVHILLLLITIPFFFWGIYIGVLLIEKRDFIYEHALYFLLLQIIIFNSPFFSIYFACGGQLSFAIGGDPFFQFLASPVSGYAEISIGNGDQPMIGINFFALALAVYFWLYASDIKKEKEKLHIEIEFNRERLLNSPSEKEGNQE